MKTQTEKLSDKRKRDSENKKKEEKNHNFLDRSREKRYAESITGK